MKLNQREAEFLKTVLRDWVEEGRLSEEQAKQLEESMEVDTFNWKSLAQTAFAVAIVSGITSFVIVLKQNLLVDLFYRLINAPYPILAGLFTLAAGTLFMLGYRRKRRQPGSLYSSEAILLLGASFAGAAIAFTGKSFDQGLNHYAILILAGAVLYLALGKVLSSLPLWLLGLATAGAWFGAETAYLSDETYLFLGMNYPLRFVIFGLLVTGAAIGIRQLPWDQIYGELTYSAGLFFTFVALWLLSIFGNYANWSAWEMAPWHDFLGYSLLLALVSAGAIWWGHRSGDQLLRGFGIIFFMLNLYTKYFEYAWDYLHRALFFAILALSFWLVGRRAERIAGYSEKQE